MNFQRKEGSDRGALYLDGEVYEDVTIDEAIEIINSDKARRVVGGEPQFRNGELAARYRTGQIVVEKRETGERQEGEEEPMPRMTFDVRFSSEEKVQFYDFFGNPYYEVLSHKRGDYDFTRFKDGSARFLESHDMQSLDAILGKISKPRVKDRESIITVELDPGHERSVVLAKRIETGFVTNVSVGFYLRELLSVEEDESGIRVERWAWEPFEASLVTIGADRTAQVLRQRNLANPQQERKMADETKSADSQLGEAQRKTDTAKVDAAEETRLAGIQAAISRNQEYPGDVHGHAEELIRNGGSGADLDEWVKEQSRIRFETKAAENVQRGYRTGATGDGEIGLSKSDAENFSLVRLINAAQEKRSNPHFNCHELEVSLATRQQLEKDNARPMSGTHSIPNDAWRNKRSLVAKQRILQAGSSPLQSNLVDTDLMSEDFISLLRPGAPLLGMVRMLNNLVGNVDIPRHSATVSPGWRTETQTISPADQGVDKIDFVPKSLGVSTEYSKLALVQSSIGLENFVVEDLQRASRLAIHFGLLVGPGTGNAPTGLVVRMNAGAAELSSQAAAATPTYEEMVDVESAVETANALEGELGYVMNATMKGTLRKSKVDGPGSGLFVIDRMTGELNGYPVIVANQLEADFSYTSNKANYRSAGTKQGLIFGNWSDIILASWMSNDLTIDDVSKAQDGVVAVTLHNAVDTNVRHLESFHVLVEA